MLGLLKTRNPHKNAAKDVYAQILKHTRQPVFYAQYGVPDSFDGRFDVLVLQVFLVVHRMLEENAAIGEVFNQALFDETFRDIDQTLREMGIGDMGVPKHMRKMMKAFNGRMHAYEAALAGDNLAGALEKNLYGTLEVRDEKKIVNMVQKVQSMLEFLRMQPLDDILSGHVQFEETE